MKKISKIILSLCLAVCCLFTAVGLTGCGKNKLSATSASTDGVSSNGGSVVTAGGYMYFINGIVANNGSTNTASGNTIGGLYRTKLNSEGKVDLNDDGTLKSSERLISSVVGFEDGQIFVFGIFWQYLFNRKYNIVFFGFADGQFCAVKYNFADQNILCYRDADTCFFLWIYFGDCTDGSSSFF